MGKIVYKIVGQYKAKDQVVDFGFNLDISDGLPFSMGMRGSWQITNPLQLGWMEPLLKPPGIWEYKILLPSSYIFCNLINEHSFVIALDDVPSDYLHGPFCSVASGKGNINLPVAGGIVPIVWQVAGPGCV